MATDALMRVARPAMVNIWFAILRYADVFYPLSIDKNVRCAGGEDRRPKVSTNTVRGGNTKDSSHLFFYTTRGARGKP